MGKCTITFRLDEEKKKALDAISESLDRDRSWVLGEAVDRYLEAHRWQVEHIKEGLRQALGSSKSLRQMAEMKIAWTKLALSDLDQAYAYISSDRPGAPRQVIERIEASVATISHHPEIGRPERVSPTRELHVLGTPLLLVYRIRKARLEILALIHAARRWPDSF